MSDYTIRGYQPGDERAILETFNLVFREVCGESYVDRELDFWRWEFEQCPFGHRISLAFTDDGVCAAQYAGVVYPMATAFGDTTFVHIVDSMAHPEHRQGLKRPGLFVKTAYPWFELCHRMGDAVMYGYPVPIAERIGQRYLEYHRLRVVNYLTLELANAAFTAPAGVAVQQVGELDPEVDALFARLAATKQCLTRRDRRYLDWRYLRMPGDAYRLFEARRDGALCGLLVLRPQHELVPGSCSIADWLVAEGDTETMDALLAATADCGRAHGRQRLLAIFPDPSSEFAAMVARGFVVMPSADTLERRLTHRIYHPQMTTEWLQQHWWYTLGDSDLI